MRAAPLALVVLAGLACGRRSLQQDADGTGVVTFDAASIDGEGTRPDVSLPDVDAARPAGDAMPAADAPAPSADANCGSIGLGWTSLAAEILIVLDRSVSLDPAQWDNFLGAVAAMIARNDLIDWGLYTFPADGPACGDGSVSTAIDVPPLPDNATHVIAHIAAAGTGAGGTPTAAAIDGAAAYMQARTNANPKFLMLVTDGAPTCAGRSGLLSPDTAQAEANAIEAISAANAAGLPTFVLAPSTAADVSALNALAVAGGHAEPGAIKFDTESTISTWFQEIGDRSCTFSLGTTPAPVPDVVAVTVNGAPVPRDRSHMLGWDYADATARSIQLYGSWCDMVVTSRSGHVNIYFGCPNPD
jgi:hypothetical protein